MKITSLECFVHESNLKIPYTIAYETISACRNVFAVARTDTGITGFGCSAPDLAITGETVESVMQDFSLYIEPALTGEEITNFQSLLDNLEIPLSGHPASMALADMLLYDLAGKKAGVPLFKYLGGTKQSIATSITLGIMETAQLLEMADEYTRKGFSILKVKGGNNTGQDIENVSRLYEKFGSAVKLRFDANQGYDLGKSVEFERGTIHTGIEFIEQPVNRYDKVLLQKVTNALQIPVMADESMLNYKDAQNICCYHIADLINIKLMKVGGIRESIRINSVARSHGVKAMAGCFDESALSVSAALHLALSQPNLVYADLDGHFDLMNDPASGAVIFKDGMLYPGEKPGLGIDHLLF